jgi:DNA modification methylase
MLYSHKKTILEILGRGPIHPFPARMAPGIALEALGDGKAPLRVLDPMAGSGTVLAVARSKGHRAYGVDIDPLAVLLASVWTRTIDPTSVNKKAAEVLQRAKVIFTNLATSRAYPLGSDDETRQFVRYWFDDYARGQLTALSAAISRVHDKVIRDVLWCGFSRLIITKSAGASRALDLSHSRPHRRFVRAPIKPFNRFLTAVASIVANCPQLGAQNLGPVAQVRQADARHLPIENGSIDLVLTSPPYLNAIDYLRCSKFSLIWMGHKINKLRKIRAESVGTEATSAEATETKWVLSLLESMDLRPKLPARQFALLARYVWDMSNALAETSRVLCRGGRAVYVVGDSTIRGTFVSNSSIVQVVAQRHGLSLKSRQARNLPANRRYLPPPKRLATAQLDGRMRCEIVMAFHKVV